MICMLRVIHYNFQVYLETLEIYERDPIHFISAPGLAWEACLKKK